MSTFAGLYPPIPTPFHSDERLNLDALADNLRKWAAEPLDGVVMPGSNSESVYLSREERIEIWRVCGEVLPQLGKRFIAGTGAETTAETITQTLIAAECGAEATLLLPPFFYKNSMSPEVLISHYRTVADASPIPVLLYNVPAFTGIDFPASLFVTLAEHPQIIGAKDSSVNVMKMASVLAARPDFQVFVGSGGGLLPFLSIGAAGSIAALANVAAKPMRAIVTAFHQGERDLARQIQLSVVHLNEALTARFGVPGLKYAMDRVGLYGGPTRRPLLPLNDAGKQEIDRLLSKLGLI